MTEERDLTPEEVELLEDMAAWREQDPRGYERAIERIGVARVEEQGRQEHAAHLHRLFFGSDEPGNTEE
jgi:hypothetical protein